MAWNVGKETVVISVFIMPVILIIWQSYEHNEKDHPCESALPQFEKVRIPSAHLPLSESALLPVTSGDWECVCVCVYFGWCLS